MYIYIYMCIYIYTHVYIYVYIYIYMYIITSNHVTASHNFRFLQAYCVTKGSGALWVSTVGAGLKGS